MNEFNQKLIDRLQAELDKMAYWKLKISDLLESEPAYAITQFGEVLMIQAYVVNGFDKVIERASSSNGESLTSYIEGLLKSSEQALLTSEWGHNSTSALKNIENLARAEAWRRQRLIFRELLGLSTLE